MIPSGRRLQPRCTGREWRGGFLVWQSGCFTVTLVTDCQHRKGINLCQRKSWILVFKVTGLQGGEWPAERAKDQSKYRNGVIWMAEITVTTHCWDYWQHWMAAGVHGGYRKSWVWHENAYLELCTWDLDLEKPDLRGDTHIHSHKWRSSKWHTVIRGGFGGENLLETNSLTAKIKLLQT